MDETNELASFCDSTQMMIPVQGQPKMEQFAAGEVPSQSETYSGNAIIDNEGGKGILLTYEIYNKH